VRLGYFLLITILKYQFLYLLLNLVIGVEKVLFLIGLLFALPVVFGLLYVLISLKETDGFLHSSYFSVLYTVNWSESLIFVVNLLFVLVVVVYCLFRYYIDEINSKRKAVVCDNSLRRPLIDDEVDGDHQDDLLCADEANQEPGQLR
jgi:hypothetical protein